MFFIVFLPFFESFAFLIIVTVERLLLIALFWQMMPATAGIFAAR
jgi:hypothetical protein